MTTTKPRLDWFDARAEIPKSLFLRMIDPPKYLNTAQRTTGVPRASDKSIYYRQYPVGWLFFTNENIESILKQLRVLGFNLSFETIHKDMIWAYDSGARDFHVSPENLDAIINKLLELNKETVRTVTNRLRAQDVGMAKYTEYMKNPNYIAATPAYLKGHKSRTIALVRGHEDVEQGGTFTSVTDAGAHNLPSVQQLTRYA